MSFPYGSDIPWLFQRNEPNALWQEMARARRQAKRTPHHPMAKVLIEQERTEEAANDEIDQALAPFDADMICPMHGENGCPEEDEQHDDDRSLHEMLEDGLPHDPLTVRAYRWLLFLRESLPVGAHESRAWLRATLNAPLVFTKLSLALDEMVVEDEPSRVIVVKELELAGVYLLRTLESMEILAKQEVIPQAIIGSLLKEGAALVSAIQKRRAALLIESEPRL